MAYIGIDLGTTNSLVTVYREGGESITLTNAFGKQLTPSVVHINGDGEMIVGEEAQQHLITAPSNTQKLFKPHMGSNKSYSVAGEHYTPVDLSSMVLRQLMDDVKRFLAEEPIESTVVTVPAYFNDSQRRATANAAYLADINLTQMITEPTAAALAYGVNQQQEGVVLVIDLGGGTYDITLMELFADMFEVKACSGDNRLGGEDFVEIIVRDFLQQHNLSTQTIDQNAYEIVRARCELLKQRLSDTEQITVEIPVKGQNLSYTLSNTRFFQLAQEQGLIDRFTAPIVRVLNDADMPLDYIDEIILVGGATRMRIFRNLIREFFPESEIKCYQPDLAVTRGAAIQAYLLATQGGAKEILVTDVASYSLGVDTYSEQLDKNLYSILIERNTPLPHSVTREYYKLTDIQTGVDFTIYQGEHLNLKENLELGHLKIKAPFPKEHPIEVTFSQDPCGLLEVEVKVEAFRIHERLVIQEQSGSLDEVERERRLKELSKLKVPPAEQAEHRRRIAILERLHEETIGSERKQVREELMLLLTVLDKGSELDIAKARRRAEKFISGYNIFSTHNRNETETIH
jgi:molecular chaperone HscC